jgi:addiction module HigA family antidote
MAELNPARGFEPNWSTHPGEHIAEYLEENGWSQAELARRAGLTPKLVSEIINGKNPVTPETALKLERVLGLKAEVWLGLQSSWDLFHARQLSCTGACWERLLGFRRPGSGSSGSLRGTPAIASQPETSKPRSVSMPWVTLAAWSRSASDHAVRPALRMRRLAASSPAHRASCTASLYDLIRTTQRLRIAVSCAPCVPRVKQRLCAPRRFSSAAGGHGQSSVLRR